MSLADRAYQTLHGTLVRLAQEGAFGEGGAEKIRGAAWSVERPKRPEHGDFATNAAMVLTKRVGMPPRAIAELLVKALAGNDIVRSAEIAGPGFVNLRLHPKAFHAEVAAIVAEGTSYGIAKARTGERVHVEFVSANPTGPITVAAGRNAIFGDAVATLIEATGNHVAREYYINDFGNQVNLFAESVLAVAEGRPVPEDGYKGAYVSELAAWLQKIAPEALANAATDRASLSRVCITWMLAGIPGSSVLRGIKRTLADLGVHHDVWFSEESLHRWGAVDIAVNQLEASGHLVKKDGAVFFVAKEGADDKDRVVRKSDGAYTYFASDIAYHADKLSRGYTRLVNVLGADHHGYIARIRNVLDALGLPSSAFEALIYQLVFILRDGQPVKSSKRAGNVVTMDELMDEIDEAAGRKGAGRDALRFFFLCRSANSNIEFDIELAKKKSLDNPVFYVQYGSARLHSILARAKELAAQGVLEDPEARPLDLAELAALVHPDELALTAKVAEFPALLKEAAEGREPHKVANYVLELARQFQSYYSRLKGENDPILPPAALLAAGGKTDWDFAKTRARLEWIKAVRNVYVAALGLLGVSAPSSMHRAESSEGADDADDLSLSPEGTTATA
jgi:arginyl-tRNA synthetase